MCILVGLPPDISATTLIIPCLTKYTHIRMVNVKGFQLLLYLISHRTPLRLPLKQFTGLKLISTHNLFLISPQKMHNFSLLSWKSISQIQTHVSLGLVHCVMNVKEFDLLLVLIILWTIFAFSHYLCIHLDTYLKSFVFLSLLQLAGTFVYLQLELMSFQYTSVSDVANIDVWLEGWVYLCLCFIHHTQLLLTVYL